MKRSLTATLAVVAITVAALAACGGSSTTGTPASGATSPAATATTGGATGSPVAVDGAEVFAQNCAGCHGSAGAGGRGPDITGKTDTTAVEDQVRNGGTSMPAFGDTLSDEQIAAVAEYVTTQL